MIDRWENAICYDQEEDLFAPKSVQAGVITVQRASERKKRNDWAVEQQQLFSS